MINSVNYIITAKHYATREGVQTVKQRILKTREKLHKRNSIPITINDINKPRGKPVQARIELGQWIADCECGGAEFVAPEEPIFFCFSCGNRENGHVPRPVTFPDEATRLEIERLVLERPVDDRRGLDDLQRAHMATPSIYVEVEEVQVEVDEAGVPHERKIKKTFPLTRSWNPEESLVDLREQNRPVKEWHERLKDTQGPKEGKAQ